MPPRPATASILCPAKIVPGSSSPIGERYIGRSPWSSIHPYVTGAACECDGSGAQEAGDRGIEPRFAVLETAVMAVTLVPPEGGHCSDRRPFPSDRGANIRSCPS